MRTHMAPDNSHMNICKGAGVAALIASLWACSPALNWRTGRMEVAPLDYSLPCKADRAAREVRFGEAELTLSMVGCEADGATFAISHMVLPAGSDPNAALTQWRTAALARLGAVTTLSEQGFALPGTLQVPASLRLRWQGQGGEGQALTGEGVWFAQVRDTQVHLYHAVVYAKKLPEAVASTFLAGLKLPS